jgi:peptidoglycan hydrolase-like protein with peptidoglycan-binding domain
VILQTLLENAGLLQMPQGIAKGYYGQLTKQAVIKLQKRYNVVPASGYFGPITRNLLNAQPS